MKKISILYKKDPNDWGRVINEINPENDWVFNDGIPTRKFDGTSCMIKDFELYKRYDAKRNRKTGKWKQIPIGAIPCQEPDKITGHHPHWIKCDVSNGGDTYHLEAFSKLSLDAMDNDGTYALIVEM